MNREPDIELDVTYLPFELHADTPEAGLPLAEYFRAPPQQMAQMHENLRTRAEDLGLPFHAPTILSNTMKAHILSEYAREQGKLDALHRVLFRANFVEGANLSDDGVLRAAAGEAGLDPDAAMASLQDPGCRERVEEALARSRAIGITGVPAFVVEDKYLIVGAHPYEAMRDALRRIAQEAG